MFDYPFRKYAGAGNDFIVLDASRVPVTLTEPSLKALVKLACARSNGGIGSDGLILLEPSHLAPFGMRFFNPDGSYGALCGNGSRCAVQAAADNSIIQSATTDFEVLGAVNHAELLGDELVRVYFQDPKWWKLHFKVRIGKKDFLTTNYVDLGSQHTVTFFEDLATFASGSIDDFEIGRFGPLLRWQPDFQPLGVNANFAEMRKDADGDYIRIRTFERGVEGETLACGTGCMSTAIVAYSLGKTKTLPIRLQTQSGEFVEVNFVLEDEAIKHLSLKGSATRGKYGVIHFDETHNTFSCTIG